VNLWHSVAFTCDLTTSVYFVLPVNMAFMVDLCVALSNRDMQTECRSRACTTYAMYIKERHDIMACLSNTPSGNLLLLTSVDLKLLVLSCIVVGAIIALRVRRCYFRNTRRLCLVSQGSTQQDMWQTTCQGAFVLERSSSECASRRLNLYIAILDWTTVCR
jgi:hypothetical protein